MATKRETIRHRSRPAAVGWPAAGVVTVLAVYGRLLAGQGLFDYDSVCYMAGLKQLAAACWRSWRIPSVNPYILCGGPLLTDITCAPLDPMNALVAAGGREWGMPCYTVGYYIAAVLTSYLFARVTLRCRRPAALTGAVGFACGGYVWSVMDMYYFQAAAWVPLTLWGILGCLSASPGRRRSAARPDAGSARGILAGIRRRRRYVIGSAAGICLLCLCGNFQQLYDTLLLAGAIVVVVVALRRRDGHGCRPRPKRGSVASVALGIGVGLLLALPQLLPTFLESRSAYRAGGVPLSEALSRPFPAVRLVELICPFAFGVSQDGGRAMTGFVPQGVPWVRTVFVGMPLVAGAVVALSALGHGGRRSRAIVGGAAVLLTALLFAVGPWAPLFRGARLLPGFDTFRHPAKYVFWIHGALVFLGAIGIDLALRSPRFRGRLARGALVLGLLAGAGPLGWTLWDWLAPGGLAGWLVTHGCSWQPGRWLRWQWLHSGLAAAAGLGLWGACRQTPGWRVRPLAWWGVAATAVPLAIGSATVNWAVPRHWVTQHASAAQSMPPEITTGRYRIQVNAHAVGAGAPLQGCTDSYVQSYLAYLDRLPRNVPALHQIRTMGGFSPLVDPRYLDAANPRTRDGLAMLDFMCASHCIVQAQAADAPLPPGISVAAVNRTGGYAVLENRGALPRIAVTRALSLGAGSVARAMDVAFEQLEQRRQSLADGGTVSEAPVVLAGPADEEGGPRAAESTGGDADVLRDAPGEISVRCDGPGWLVVRDQYLKGWHARVDGKPAAIERADGLFMTVQVGPGSHLVDLHYRAPGLLAGGIGALLGVALLTLVPLIGQGRQGRRGGQPLKTSVSGAVDGFGPASRSSEALAEAHVAARQRMSDAEARR